MNLIGHIEEIELLKKAEKENRLASAYILSGPEGVGKKLVLQKFIMGLYCESACGVCPKCQKIVNDSHPDIFNVSLEEDKKDISIEQMRTVQGKVQMHPLEGRYKFVIIDNAERMNQAAANSALKILEEPPRDTHFFLITSRSHMFLPTIISRCQKITFSPLPVEEIVPIIEERLKTDKETAGMMALISCGSLGLALTFPVDTLKDAKETITRIQKTRTPSEIIATAERWGKSDANHLAILAAIASVYRGTLAGDPAGSLPKLQRIISAERDLEATYNKQLLFEQLLFALTSG